MPHTPGPWRADSSFAHFWMVDSGVGTIAHGCHEADAKLIAAAPELLATAKRALDILEANYDEGDEEDADDMRAIRELRNAIIKAEGGRLTP